jgi:alkanesulfonate monooxygenase SsuD/methylene tetrahydromethanopterin reductase-like flavin-dependent oxidoreductase (luciferase family)
MPASSATVSVVPDGVLAYGMQLPVQALSVRVSMPWEQEATVDDLVRVARAADDAGFLYVAVCHHVAIPPEPAEMMSRRSASSPRTRPARA